MVDWSPIPDCHTACLLIYAGTYTLSKTVTKTCNNCIESLTWKYLKNEPGGWMEISENTIQSPVGATRLIGLTVP